MTPRVSVVVNTYNRAASLATTLEALEHLEHPQFEVVVVNGPSTDGTDQLLAKYRGRIKVGHCAERNLSASRNIGIRMSAGDVVAFIDDDAYPDPGWLDALSGAYVDEVVAAAGGPTFDHTGYGLQAAHSLADHLGEAWAEMGSGADATDYYSFPYSDRFIYTIGTNSSFRRDLLTSIGGFDEEFAYYADEADVCCRLADSGYVVRALDDGFIYHKFLPSEMRYRSDVVNDWSQVLKSRFYFALKHGQPLHSFAEICTSLSEFVARIRARVHADFAAGSLSAEAVAKFETDVHEASDRAFQSYIRRPDGQPRPPSWFTVTTDFLPFPARHAGMRRLHVCLVTSEYPPDPVNGIGRVVHSLACGLARRGHIVRVLTSGRDHNRVDLEDGVWVHRLLPVARPQTPMVPLPDHVWSLAAAVSD